MSGGERPPCGRHPEAIAELACDRCGDFVCAACLAGETALVCLLCREQTGQDRIAWERPSGSLASRYLSTAHECLMLPDQAGASIANGGSVPRALAYVATVPAAFTLAFCGLAALGSLVAVLDASSDAQLSAMRYAVGLVVLPLLVAPTAAALWAAHVGITTAMFHLTARVLGGDGGLSASLRGAGYFTSLAIWLFPAVLVAMVPCFGIVVLGLPVWLALSFVLGMREVASKAHHLNETRATVAALVPLLVYATVFFAWAALAWG